MPFGAYSLMVAGNTFGINSATVPALPDIRSRFHPVQPTLSPSEENVLYTEWVPDIKLAPFIYCYWQLRTIHPHTQPFCYRVVADGCIDILFDMYQPEDVFVMGFSTTFTEFPLPNSFNYVGIRFLPTAFPLLFHVNAAELTNRFENLAAVTPAISKDIGRLIDDKLRLHTIKETFDAFFIRLLATQSLAIDNRLFNAVDVILRAQGTLSIEQEIDTGLSSRQLRRLFDFYIGDSPKVFSKVVRFQNILNAKPSRESLRHNKLFYDAGYYDQAHFIKEFKTLFGVTPSRAFNR